MAASANSFSLLNDGVEDGSQDVVRVAAVVEEERKKEEATAEKKKQKKEKEKKKKEQSRALDLRREYLPAKPLMLPWYVIRSQIVIRKEKPEEECRAGLATTVLSNSAAQKQNGGYQRNYGERRGSLVNGNQRGDYRRNYGRRKGNNGEANGGYRRNKAGNNGHEGNKYGGEAGYGNDGADLEVADESEGWQIVRGRRRGRAQRRVFSENTSNVGSVEETQAADEQSEKQVQKNGTGNDSENKCTDEEPRKEEKEKNSDGENRSGDGDGSRTGDDKGKERRSSKGRFGNNYSQANGVIGDNAFEEKKKKREPRVYAYTLKEYERRLEKLKPLPLGESLRKTEERTVALDKDFKSMQIIGKKKEGDPYMARSNKSEKESLQKVSKSKTVSIDEFLSPVRGPRRFAFRRRWSDEAEEESSQQPRETTPEDVPDLCQFPELTIEALKKVA